MIPLNNYLEVIDLLSRYAHVVDSDRLEEWPDFFVPDCHYKIITIENIQQGFEAGIVLCDGQSMLKDRVTYIRKAAVFNAHRDRHILSHPVIFAQDGDTLKVTTSFAIYQSEPDRDSRLFAVGYYDDLIVRTEEGLKFSARVVVLENNSVMPLLCSPL